MTSVEQRRMLDDLRRFVRNMDKEERFVYEMMVKREKDDEQLDALTLRELEMLHAKYVPRRSKESIENAWRKLAGGTKEGKAEK